MQTTCVSHSPGVVGVVKVEVLHLDVLRQQLLDLELFPNCQHRTRHIRDLSQIFDKAMGVGTNPLTNS